LTRRAVGIGRVAAEFPALAAQAGDRVGDGDGLAELLQRAKDQRAVRPGAAIGDVEVVAAGLGFEARRAVGRDAVAEKAVDAREGP
jgi:hypothetical protein